MKTENITNTGTIFASILAAICCIGPVVAIITGVSIGFLDTFMFLDPYRPVFLGAAFVLLGYSFWKLYIVKAPCTCDADIRSRRITRTIFWAGAIIFIIAASYQHVIIWLLG